MSVGSFTRINWTGGALDPPREDLVVGRIGLVGWWWPKSWQDLVVGWVDLSAPGTPLPHLVRNVPGSLPTRISGEGGSTNWSTLMEKICNLMTVEIAIARPMDVGALQQVYGYRILDLDQ